MPFLSRSPYYLRTINFLLPINRHGLNHCNILTSQIRALCLYQCQTITNPRRSSRFLPEHAGRLSAVNRSYYNSPSEEVSNPFKWLAMKVKKIAERGVIAKTLYETIDDIKCKEFYEFLEMPDTFNSWFVIVELHIWMIISILMSRNRDDFKLRNEIVKFLWLDVEARTSNLGNTEKKYIKKQVKELSVRFPVALLVYDEGLMSDDTALASALWYKFFDKEVDDPIKIEVLVRYVRHQIHTMSLMNIRSCSPGQKLQLWSPLSDHIKEVKKLAQITA